MHVVAMIFNNIFFTTAVVAAAKRKIFFCALLHTQLVALHILFCQCSVAQFNCMLVFLRVHAYRLRYNQGTPIIIIPTFQKLQLVFCSSLNFIRLTAKFILLVDGRIEKYCFFANLFFSILNA